MPEGHTIHRAALDQSALLDSKRVRADSPQGRFDDGAALLDGRTLHAIEPYGKHLFYDFGAGMWLHVHLGLFGRFRSGRPPVPPARGAVRLRLMTDDAWLLLSGPTACEVLDTAGRKRILARLGPDPLRKTARATRAIERISASSTPIGVLLMDQSVIAGIGNVYRAELLFRANLHPRQSGKTIEPARLARVWSDTRAVMNDGVRDRRMITTIAADRPHPTGAVRPGERHYVYHRTGKPCFICGTAIEAATLAARTVYWCAICQPLDG